MRSIDKILGARILIKKLNNVVETKSGLTIKDDGESLPKAEVVMVSEDITQVNVGDKIHYLEARESGKCLHNSTEHFIISISNTVAIIDE